MRLVVRGVARLRHGRQHSGRQHKFGDGAPRLHPAGAAHATGAATARLGHAGVLQRQQVLQVVAAVAAGGGADPTHAAAAATTTATPAATTRRRAGRRVLHAVPQAGHALQRHGDGRHKGAQPVCHRVQRHGLRPRSTRARNALRAHGPAQLVRHIPGRHRRRRRCLCRLVRWRRHARGGIACCRLRLRHHKHVVPRDRCRCRCHHPLILRCHDGCRGGFIPLTTAAPPAASTRRCTCSCTGSARHRCAAATIPPAQHASVAARRQRAGAGSRHAAAGGAAATLAAPTTEHQLLLPRLGRDVERGTRDGEERAQLRRRDKRQVHAHHAVQRRRRGLGAHGHGAHGARGVLRLGAIHNARDGNVGVCRHTAAQRHVPGRRHRPPQVEVGTAEGGHRHRGAAHRHARRGVLAPAAARAAIPAAIDHGNRRCHRSGTRRAAAAAATAGATRPATTGIAAATIALPARRHARQLTHLVERDGQREGLGARPEPHMRVSHLGIRLLCCGGVRVWERARPLRRQLAAQVHHVAQPRQRHAQEEGGGRRAAAQHRHIAKAQMHLVVAAAAAAAMAMRAAAATAAGAAKHDVHSQRHAGGRVSTPHAGSQRARRHDVAEGARGDEGEGQAGGVRHDGGKCGGLQAARERHGGRVWRCAAVGSRKRAQVAHQWARQRGRRRGGHHRVLDGRHGAGSGSRHRQHVGLHGGNQAADGGKTGGATAPPAATGAAGPSRLPAAPPAAAARLQDGAGGQRVGGHAPGRGRQRKGRRNGVRAARRVRVADQQLQRRLAVVRDLHLRRLAHRRLLDGVNVHAAGVRHVVEHVVGRHRGGAALLVPKHEVHPAVQHGGHPLRLQRRAQRALEGGGRGRPGRQAHVVHRAVVLQRAKVVARGVDEEVRLAVPLWRQLLHLRQVGGVHGPRVRHGAKQAVRHVKVALLVRHVDAREGVQAQQVVHHRAHRRAVVAAVQELGDGVVVKRLVPRAELLQPAGRHGAHGARQVAVGGGRRQVHRARRVVAQHPREHGVLRQVVEGAPRQRVQRHQVVKVGEAARLPRAHQLAEHAAEVRRVVVREPHARARACGGRRRARHLDVAVADGIAGGGAVHKRLQAAAAAAAATRARAATHRHAHQPHALRQAKPRRHALQHGARQRRRHGAHHGVALPGAALKRQEVAPPARPAARHQEKLHRAVRQAEAPQQDGSEVRHVPPARPPRRRHGIHVRAVRVDVVRRRHVVRWARAPQQEAGRQQQQLAGRVPRGAHHAGTRVSYHAAIPQRAARGQRRQTSCLLPLRATRQHGGLCRRHRRQRVFCRPAAVVVSPTAPAAAAARPRAVIIPVVRHRVHADRHGDWPPNTGAAGASAGSGSLANPRGCVIIAVAAQLHRTGCRGGNVLNGARPRQLPRQPRIHATGNLTPITTAAAAAA